MPIDSARHRAFVGRHETQYGTYLPTTATQEILNGVADAQMRKSPRRSSVLTFLYASALLPHLKMVESTPSSLNKIARAQDNANHGLATVADAVSVVATREAKTSLCTVVPPQACDAVHTDVCAIQRRSVKNKMIPARPPSTAFFSFPMTAASVQGSSLDVIRWQEQDELFIAEGQSARQQILGFVKIFLLRKIDIDNRDAETLEYNWRLLATNGPLLIAPVNNLYSFYRDKRISVENRNKQISAHIEENCIFETEIFSEEGQHQGSLLLLKAQRAENPFRMLYDNKASSSVSQTEHYAAEGLNFITDVFTLGFKSVIGNLLANYYRTKYFMARGDSICVDRQIHLSFVQIATVLDIGGLTFPMSRKARISKPIELAQATPTDNNAAFYARNKNTGIERELKLSVKETDAEQKNTADVFFKPDGDAGLVSVPADPGKQKKRVTFDQNLNSWRYANVPDSPALELEVTEGKLLAMVDGERYELHVNENKNMKSLSIGAMVAKIICPYFRGNCPKHGIWKRAIVIPVLRHNKKC